MSNEAATTPSIGIGFRTCPHALAQLRDYCVRIARHFDGSAPAEDVAQEALLALLATPSVDSPQRWLWTVVRRLVSTQFHQRARYVPLAETPEAAGVVRPDGVDGRLALEKLLARLDTRDRRILTLRLEGYSYREIAQVLGCRVEAVGTLVHRAVTRCRRAAGGE